MDAPLPNEHIIWCRITLSDESNTCSGSPFPQMKCTLHQDIIITQLVIQPSSVRREPSWSLIVMRGCKHKSNICGRFWCAFGVGGR